MRQLWSAGGVFLLAAFLFTGCATRGSVAALRQDFDAIERRIGKVERQLAGHQTGVERLEGTLGGVKSQLEALSKAQADLDAKLDQFVAGSQGLQAKLAGLEKVSVREPVPKKPEPIPETAVRPEGPPAPTSKPPTAPVKETFLKDIFFDFDKAVIRDDAVPILDENVEWLKANPRVRITIEGHCDERGTNEYNLALGERRARAAKEYLVAAGIDPGRIVTISYGEERPFVLGHDEEAWRWNRRAHFVITGAP